MNEGRPRIVLADDHSLMLAGLKRLLEPDFEIAAMVTDGEALLEAVTRLHPELVVTDLSMPGLDGIEATRRLSLLHPTLPVLILSLHTDASWVRAAFEAGARGYLSKASSPDELRTALGQLLQGRFYVSPHLAGEAIAAAVRNRPPAPTAALLTPRELDIVRLVARGLANKDIARHLGVSVTTVRTHLNKVYGKMGTASRVTLALAATQLGSAVM